MIALKKADTETDFNTIEQLAKEVLHEVYDPIIPSDHTAFFLKEFQSASAIKHQIEQENYHYYLLNYADQNVGYLGIQNLHNKLNLSKLYILKSFRGLKIGKAALAFVHEFAIDNNIKKIDLIVNQANQNTIEIYQKIGFKITKSITHSFPNGHSVEDYQMEKTLI